jgi:hypothetical protein
MHLANGPLRGDRDKEGGIRQRLDEKWRKVYQANAPRGLFGVSELRAA